MTTSRIELLQRMPIFGAIRDDTLAFLLGFTRDVQLRADDWFFREGDEPTGLYVLEAGRARVFKGWHDRLVELHALGPGDCFGEMALMDFMPRSASVRAETDCRAIELGSGDLYRLCKYDAEQFALIQMNLGREVSRRLRATDDELFRLRMATRPAGS